MSVLRGRVLACCRLRTVHYCTYLVARFRAPGVHENFAMVSLIQPTLVR